MPDLTIAFTVPGEAIAGYLAIGVLLWLPLEWKLWRSIRRPPPFWRETWRLVKKRPHVPPLAVIAWPLSLWEAFR